MQIPQALLIAFGLTAAAYAQSIRVVDKGGPPVLYAPDPEYPDAAWKAGIEGDVVLRIHIAPDGRVDRATPTSGHPLLIPPAIRAMKQFQFMPREARADWVMTFSRKHRFFASVPVATRQVEPVYPAEAKRKGISGTVRLVALFNEAGRVQNIETVTGNPQLVPAAKEALQQWEFRSTRPDGRRTGGTAVVEIRLPAK